MAGWTGPVSMLRSNRPIETNKWETQSSAFDAHGVEEVTAAVIGVH